MGLTQKPNPAGELSLRLWLVERVANIWSEEFSHDPGKARRAMLGGAPVSSGEAPHLRAMLLMFTQLKESAEEGIAYAQDLMKNSEDRKQITKFSVNIGC